MSIQLLPADVKRIFRDPGYCLWCGSVTRGDDGRFYMFYSRWPSEFGHYGWVTHSEIACAVSDEPTGPFRPSHVVLASRGDAYWDGACTHNPLITRFGGRYYLYHMGNRGDRATPDGGLNFTHRNNQRIGVAVADNVAGPWARFDRPLIDVSPQEDAPDALCVANPSVCEMADGRYLMIYKAVARQRPLPFGGPVVHLAAVADSPTGPFGKKLTPLFTKEGSFFAAEDPFIWRTADGYHAIVKDMHGEFTGRGTSLAVFESKDGLHWNPAAAPLVTTLDIAWADGQTRPLCKLERPQLWIDAGRPRVLYCAAAFDGALDDSFNIALPITSEHV